MEGFFLGGFGLHLVVIRGYSWDLMLRGLSWQCSGHQRVLKIYPSWPLARQKPFPLCITLAPNGRIYFDLVI